MDYQTILQTNGVKFILRSLYCKNISIVLYVFSLHFLLFINFVVSFSLAYTSLFVINLWFFSSKICLKMSSIFEYKTVLLIFLVIYFLFIAIHTVKNWINNLFHLLKSFKNLFKNLIGVCHPLLGTREFVSFDTHFFCKRKL